MRKIIYQLIMYCLLNRFFDITSTQNEYYKHKVISTENCVSLYIFLITNDIISQDLSQ